MYDSARATSGNLSNRPLRRKLRLRGIRQFVPGHSRAPAPGPGAAGITSPRPALPELSSGTPESGVLFFLFSVGVQSLYGVVLVSAAPQCESALCKVHPVPPEPPALHALEVITAPGRAPCCTAASHVAACTCQRPSLHLSCPLLPLPCPCVCSLRQRLYSCPADRVTRTVF